VRKTTTDLYYQAVTKTDSLIGLVVKAVKDAGIQNNTLLIITADHGGIGYGHGGATTEEAEIAMILSGKMVKKGYRIQQQVYTYDLAATIAFALHIVPPYAWTGRPIKSAFIGFY
jgi:arylsulfatase A-like enzyme